MNDNKNIFGYFIMYPQLLSSATNLERQLANEEGEIVKSFIWGDLGIANYLSSLEFEEYGQDIKLILFQLYVKPLPFYLQSLKEIENYRKDERSIGISIIINEENFFKKTDNEKCVFFKESITEKLNRLKIVVKKKKLDTNVELLKMHVELALNHIQ